MSSITVIARLINGRYEHNESQSPLLRLPGELRNRIYELALSGTTWYIKNSNRVVANNTSKYILSLSRVCRKLYHETSTLAFTLGSFRAGDPKDVHQWLIRRNEGAGNLTSLSFESSVIGYYFEGTIMNEAEHLYWWCKRWLTFTDLPHLQRVLIFVSIADWEEEDYGFMQVFRAEERALKLQGLKKAFTDWDLHVERLNRELK